jgi:high-affinity Fe2+/Pb2+ permease
MWILLLALWYVPFVGGAIFGLIASITLGLGVDRLLIAQGFDLFQFWR